MNDALELLMPGETRVMQPLDGAFALVLEGSDARGLPLEAAFAPAAALPVLPQRLHELRLANADGERAAWRIHAREGEFVVPCSGLFVHRDLSAVMHRAIPPRRAPLAKRLFWRLVLLLGASAAGRALLTRLRSR